MNKLILIKFGGSLITEKNKVNVARFDVINNLARQVKDIIGQSQIQLDKISKINPIPSDSIRLNQITSPSIIIATGAGGFGHPVAKKYKNNLASGEIEIKKAVKKINQIVVDLLNNEGVKAESVEPSRFAEYRDGKMVSLLHGSIVSLLEKNIIPVFHADLVNDQTNGLTILSMDRFLVDVAIDLKQKGFEVEKVIFCGTTDGVLDDKGKTIAKINKEYFVKIKKYFYDNNQVDTTGGMRSKVSECLRLINENIPCIITSGSINNNLKNTIFGLNSGGTKITD